MFNPAEYPDLACADNGGRILFATDDFFAVCENLIAPQEPVWDPNTYTPEGKEMDGWETRRKRTLGHDWCIIQLGLPGQIKGFDIDTAWFTGNNVPGCSIQAYCGELDLKRVSKRGSAAPKEEIERIGNLTKDWVTLCQTKLSPGVPETRHTLVEIQNQKRWTHLRLNLYPDGGIARLRVYGTVLPDWSKMPKQIIDVASLQYGGKAIKWSNAHYGNPMRLLATARSTGMHDGWETARNPNRPPVFKLGNDGMIEMVGKDWAIIKLGHEATIKKVIVDTNHYKGNYPESCMIECSTDSQQWKPLLKRVKLTAHAEHEFKVEPNSNVSYIRLTMYPDGGISRLRVFGDWFSLNSKL
ncbi:hypothetical protein HK103_001791 [Boothiomyces macroporosus]|uniref:Allantoicase domain-containing protein n=1 Tax=Boothiomyces macroporosus TaxID=261099 RepID=A0AAD5Y538_9FUNG|nr:hypothetical protein HK103_001791 [Boothiomyces macroporosus]